MDYQISFTPNAEVLVAIKNSQEPTSFNKTMARWISDAVYDLFQTKEGIDVAVTKEIERQFEKRGVQNNSVHEWNSYLLEEYGEAVKNMNDANFEKDLDKRRELWYNAIKEAVEMIAVSVHWIHEMQRRRDEEER